MFIINAFQLVCITIALGFGIYYHCADDIGYPTPLWVKKWMSRIMLFALGSILSIFFFQVF